MALKFIGERTVGTLNGMKSGFVKDDLYRVYDAGILVPGGVAVEHGDFVSWDGTKWVLEANIKIARSDEISQQSSNFAPNYTKTTYPANSYVMYGGVLYTNDNAIGTAEDWDPEHWTQTTVAEMVAGAGGGYKEVNLTFGVNDTKTIPVGQKEDVYVECQAKASDAVVIQLAEDCTDAVITLKRLNSTRFNSLTIKRGNTTIQPYGMTIITDVIANVLNESNQVLLSNNYVEGHGEGHYETPTSFDEMTVNFESIVTSLGKRRIADEFTGAFTDSWLFVVKGRAVMCLPN